MKTTRQHLQKLIKEELEQEGIFNKLKAKIAPGMAAKSLADDYAIFTVVNGVIDIDPTRIKGGPELIGRAMKTTGEMMQDERFQDLSDGSKSLVAKYFDILRKASISAKTNGVDQALSYVKSAVPKGSGLDQVFTGVINKISKDAAAGRDAESEREDRRNKQKNQFASAKDAALRQTAAAESDRLAKDPNYLRQKANAEREQERSDDAASTKNSVARFKESKNMKTTRQHLQKLIKEELDAVMKEAEEGLEEIKGAMGANMADFDRSVVDGGLDIPGTGARQAIRNVAFSADNRDEPDDDYYADDDQIGPGTKDEEIDGMLERMGIDSTSQEGMDLRMAIKAAAEKFSARSADRRDGADQLAAKSNFPPEFKKDGKLTKASTSFQKNLAKKSLGLGEAEELEEVKEMEQISESFRRFTKILKG